MVETAQNVTANRYRMLDLLRGVTVFLMIAAHAVYFFHNDTNVLLTLFEKFGNTVAFTVFLIVSAATAEIAYFSKEEVWPEKRKRLLKRVAVLTAGYFALAFMVFFANIVSTYGLDRLWLILNIISLRNLAPFAEFFIPFMVIPLIIAAFPKLFRKIIQSVPLALIVGLAVYLLGMFYYKQPIWDFLLPWKALFFGAAGYFRFPIFQYFPVYLLGMVWGNRLLKTKNVKHQREMSWAVMATSAVALALIVGATLFTGGAMDGIINRWPPSVPFLLVGTFFAAFLAWIFYKTNQLKKIPVLRDGILVLGQNALGLALIHVFLLQIYSLSGGLKTGSVFLYLFSLVILLIISVALAAVIPFNFRFSLNLEKGDYHEDDLEAETLVQFEEEVVEDVEEEVGLLKKFFYFGTNKRGSKKLIKKRHLMGVALVISLVALVVFPPVVQEYVSKKQDAQQVAWDAASFGWRERLTITNNENLAEIPQGNMVKWRLDHASLVTAKKAYPDGRDLWVRYWDGKKFQAVNYWLVTEPNTANTTIAIEMKERLKPGDTTSSYYLYYGNNLAKSAFATKSQPTLSNIKYLVSAKDEESYPLLLTVDRRWSILSEDKKIPTTLRVALQTTGDFVTKEASYVVAGTNLSGKLEKTADNLWEGVINVRDLKPGQYEITAVAKDGQTAISSSHAGFFVSYPLYVAWTQDWEGYDVPDVYLSAITQVARDHGVVITHFWNPRLTTTDTVSQARKDALLSWIKERKDSFGESIQMHLHMFNDFVTASGVTPKNTANWGDSGDGYGSLTTNYSAADLTKIIKKGLEVIKSSGLGTPTIYRAGGWFANEDTLKAEYDSGLLADSSGRTSYKFYSQTGPWDLSQTAQPYYPSVSDQNKAGTPAVGILEIPNNGADSYWFSTEEMKKRFTANYGGGILTDPRQITYLSHPHWFNKAEQSKIESVFALVDKYKYDNDSGPAVYVTQDEIYSVWAKR